MMGKERKKVGIFIGSSITELEFERAKLMSFIQGLNNKYYDRGLFFEGYVCEETTDEIRAGGSQKLHDDFIKSRSDVAIFMFFHKAGEFTLNELKLARESFLTEGKPGVFVFFKAIDGACAADEEIKKCVDLVANEFGHYFKMFDHIDTVKLELLQFLISYLPGAGEVTVQDGKVYMGKEEVDGIDVSNVFAYRNNPELARLAQEQKELIAQMTETSAKGDVNGTLRLSAKLGETQKKYRELEKVILETMRFFFEENKKGKKADPRRMEALRLLELGKVKEALMLITQEELVSRAESIDERRTLTEEVLQNDEQELVSDALVRIKALENDVENASRFDEIEWAYDAVYHAAVSVRVYKAIYNFADFLWHQKKYPKGITVAEKLRYLYSDPDVKIEDEQKAKLFNLLANFYANNGKPKEAEKLYLEALEIYRILSKKFKKVLFMSEEGRICNNLAVLYGDEKPKETEILYLESLAIRKKLSLDVSKEAFDSDVAETCNNLASFYTSNGKPKEAEKLYWKSLTIYRELSQEVDKETFEADLALTCNNLALFYAENGKWEEAEKLFLESLAIYKRRAEVVNRARYEPNVALICNNLANFYADNGKTGEAEKMYLEALEINHRLFKEVSQEAYEPDIAWTYHNLAGFYMGNGNSSEAEKLYWESLAIYRKLVKNVSKAKYEPLLAGVVNDLAVFYSGKNGKEKEVEELYSEALAIRRRLSEEVSQSAYEPDVAETCNNLAVFYSDNGKSEKAEKLYWEALNIYCRLSKEESKEKFDPRVAKISNNLGDFYADHDRPEESEKLYLEALAIYRRLSIEVSKSKYEKYVADTCTKIADFYADNGRPQEAEKYYINALAIFCELSKEEGEEKFVADIAMTNVLIAVLNIKNGEVGRGKRILSRALLIAEKYYDVDPRCRKIVDMFKA